MTKKTNALATVALYWKVYGGIKHFMLSPYLLFSIVLCVITVHFPLTQPWWQQVIDVVPNILGFTLGGFALFLGFGDDKFKSIICGVDEGSLTEHSPYMGISATFLHFVLIQTFSLLFAIVAKGLNFTASNESLAKIMSNLILITNLFNMIGYWLFLYGLSLIIATAIAIFRLANWYDKMQASLKQNKPRK